MKTLNPFSNSIRNTSIHVVILLVILYIISLYFPLSKVRGEYLWQPLTEVLLIITAFYVHTLILLPLLLKKKNTFKYVIWTALGFLLFWILTAWFRALVSSHLVRYMDGTRPDPLDMFLQPDQLLYYFLGLLVIFIPATAVSLLYYILLIDQKEREKLFKSKYVEPYINILLLIPIFILIIFNASNTIEGRIDLLYLLIIFTLYFYLNACLFVKEFLDKKNSGRFIFLNALSLILLFVGTAVIYGIDYLKEGNYANLLNIGIIFFVLFSLSFIYGYLRFKLKTSEKIFSLRLGAKDSELRLLKSQVNPHFLFNTLNTIYATALEENAPITAQSTAKVASLIRYMQNDINKDFIPLENEIRYLEDFIAIQKLRSGVPVEVKTEFRNIENKEISPGLFIPFVENAFKYGLNGSERFKCSISVICEEDTITFECLNSYEDNHKVSGIGEGFGIGIKNAGKRLKLVYPERHELKIDDSGNFFRVNLQIRTKK